MSSRKRVSPLLRSLGLLLRRQHEGRGGFTSTYSKLTADCWPEKFGRLADVFKPLSRRRIWLLRPIRSFSRDH